MNDENVEAAMICARVRPGLEPVSGSVKCSCSKCGCEIWVSGEMLFTYPDAYLVCLPCELPKVQAAIEDGSIECPQQEAAPIIAAIKAGLIDQATEL